MGVTELLFQLRWPPKVWFSLLDDLYRSDGIHIDMTRVWNLRGPVKIVKQAAGSCF
jgi:uncharacterized protein involved in tellurium resistance